MSYSNNLTFELQVITPLFSSGAYQDMVEIRPPSIRGNLRFLFRAMMGGVLAANVEGIRALESRVFGNTDHASIVTIRVEGQQPDYRSFNFREKGIRYLGYGLDERSYIPVDPPYKFKLKILPKYSSIMDALLGSLWLFVTFGGLGARTRRGFGGLKVTKIEGDLPKHLLGLFDQPTVSGRVPSYVGDSISQIYTIFQKFAGTIKPLKILPSFSVIAENCWSLKIVGEKVEDQNGKVSMKPKTFSTWSGAMDWIGQEYREFREDKSKGQHSRQRPDGRIFNYYVSKDYDEAKKLFTGTTPSRLDLPIFGLPIQYQFQSLNKKGIVLGKKHDRRSSPLFIRIFKVNDSEYLVFLMKFKSQFLDMEEKISIQEVDNPGRNETLNIPDWQALDDFLNQFPGFLVG